MEKEKEEGKLIFLSPFGGRMETSGELKKRIDALPRDAKGNVKTKDFLKALDKWENEAVANYAVREKTAKSARLDIIVRK
jgi:hypothetical protein